MRKIIGYIRNLADGLGPPPGSVEVHARPEIDDVELDLTTHKLGTLERIHLTGGAGSATEADALGKFGWAMELSPGPINTQIIPTDPQTEYRWRFPDESAQVGKAFHSDIERLGWAAGRDCLVWGAIESAVQPTASTWSSDPLASSLLGDWSIASFGSGANAGRVTLRPGIAFLGGVLFSIEVGDLQVPVVGVSGASANGAGTDRWDLLYLAMNVDRLSNEYGKQSIGIQEGIPGAGIPALLNVAGSRRLVVHALKMSAAAGVYSAAIDLRPWSPEGVPGVFSPIVRSYQFIPLQASTAFGANSGLNTELASNDIILPLGSRWTGSVHWHATLIGPVGSGTLFRIMLFTEGRVASSDPAIAGTDYVLRPPSGNDSWAYNQGVEVPHSTVWPLLTIPKFQSEPLIATSRGWSRLRFRILFWNTNPNPPFNSPFVKDQHLSIHLWPVP